MNRVTNQPDLNTGKEWSKNHLFCLRRRPVGHIATFLRRTEAEVREKAAELGSSFLTQRRGNSRNPILPTHITEI